MHALIPNANFQPDNTRETLEELVACVWLSQERIMLKPSKVLKHIFRSARSSSTAGDSKLWSTGQVRPAKPYHPAREGIFSIMQQYVYEKTVDFPECNIIPNQSHCIRCLALELLCKNFCGPQTKVWRPPFYSDTQQARIMYNLQVHLF